MLPCVAETVFFCSLKVVLRFFVFVKRFKVFRGFSICRVQFVSTGYEIKAIIREIYCTVYETYFTLNRRKISRYTAKTLYIGNKFIGADNGGRTRHKIVKTGNNTLNRNLCVLFRVQQSIEIIVYHRVHSLSFG